MGHGDNLMALGDAWALHKSDPLHRKVAIGNGLALDLASYGDLSYGMSFLASQEEADAGNVPWVISFPGSRPYIDYGAMRRRLSQQGQVIHKQSKLISRLGHYIYNHSYKAKPAPIIFKPEEHHIIDRWSKKPFVVVEPFIKKAAPQVKEYPLQQFEQVIKHLKKDVEVFQISHPDFPVVCDLPRIPANSFREALAYIKASSCYVGPEGGLHHGAASVGSRAVVLFGGFIPTSVTGYDTHANMNGGVSYSCGTRYARCEHCRKAMMNIDPVTVAARTMKFVCEETNAL